MVKQSSVRKSTPEPELDTVILCPNCSHLMYLGAYCPYCGCRDFTG